jgi:hypothetical protein
MNGWNMYGWVGWEERIEKKGICMYKGRAYGMELECVEGWSR